MKVHFYAGAVPAKPPGCSSTPIGEPPQAAPMGVLEQPGGGVRRWGYQVEDSLRQGTQA